MDNLVYGFHAVISLIRSCHHNITILYINKESKNKKINEILIILNTLTLNVQYVENNYLDKLTNSENHQGVVALITKVESPNLKLFLSNMNNLHSQILILDGITDPQNLGAIIRTCSSFGVDCLIIPKNNSANINNPSVAKASSGALFLLPIIQVNNISQAIQLLQEYNYWIVGTTLAENSISLYDFDCQGKIAWVMGNEGSGIRRLVAENCDYLVKIPLMIHAQSLNVSVSTGIILSHVKYVNYIKQIKY